MAERKAEEERQRKASEAAAAKRKQVLEDAKRALISAKESRNLSQINAAVESAMKLGLDMPELWDAQSVASSLKSTDEARQQLLSAIRVLQVKSDSGIVESDLNALARAIANAEKVHEIRDTII